MAVVEEEVEVDMKNKMDLIDHSKDARVICFLFHSDRIDSLALTGSSSSTGTGILS